LSRLEPNRFFRNNNDGTFTDYTSRLGLARPGNKGHGACLVDIDDDGDLDLYTQLGGHYPGDHAANAFYRNLEANKSHWLQIELTGLRSNRFGVGAAVVVKAGTATLYREVKGSEGFGSTSPFRQHFGLGTHAGVVAVEIRWPSGLKQTFEGLESNRLYEMREGAAAARRVREATA
jgi:hypothetical protein